MKDWFLVLPTRVQVALVMAVMFLGLLACITPYLVIGLTGLISVAYSAFVLVEWSSDGCKPDLQKKSRKLDNDANNQ